jgi:DNA polymerase elongation subunit (family B)
LKPDPKLDEVCAIFCSFTDEIQSKNYQECILMVEDTKDPLLSKSTTELFSNEEELLKGFVSLVSEIDPDIITGYDVQKLSLGYLIDRSYVACKNLQY